MARPRHLSVARTPEEEHAAKTAALRQIGDRVPTRMAKTYDWDSPNAVTLFESMNPYVADGMSVRDIESLLDMDGLAEAFYDWLAARHS